MSYYLWNKATDQVAYVPFNDYLQSLKQDPGHDDRRRVGGDTVKTPFGSIYVSTVFLHLDHSFDGGTPVLFETMMFGGPWDEWQKRYCTAAEARIGHAHALRTARQARWRPDLWLGYWWSKIRRWRQ